MNQTIESAPLTNLTQLRDELDWQENRQSYVEWQRRPFAARVRDLLEYAIVMGLLFAAVSACFVLRIGE